MEEEDKGKWLPCEKCGEAFRKKDASLKVRNLCSKCKNAE
jgi:formylmethanofuran dehydrogenase subunit E